jgi:hypothetical protein
VRELEKIAKKILDEEADATLDVHTPFETLEPTKPDVNGRIR